MKTIEVVAAIIRRGDEVFATQRGYGDWKDYWEWPGGKIEAGETPEQALVREIREELDAEIRIDKYLTTIEWDYPQFHLIMHCYFCSLQSESLHLNEHEAARWLKADDLHSVHWLPADDQLLPLIEREMKVPVADKRLSSLDILRGADMFLLLWIGPVVRALCKAYPGGTAWLSGQVQHVAWDGFALWDIIMPLFLFLSGITIPFSMAKYKNGLKPERKFYLKLFRRFFLLFLLGWIVQGNLLEFDWKLFHPFANTLQAIAVGYVIAALLFVHCKPRWQMVAAIALFALYWIAFAFTEMNLDKQGNIAMVIDKAVLGSHRDGVAWAADGAWRFRTSYQYTWILSSLNFAVTVLLGCFAGQMLKSEKFSKAKRALGVAAVGAVLIAAGLACAPVFPIIKKIWSSSMTLFSGGICFLLVALTYYLVDVRGWHKGADWLKIYGMNAITAYCIGEVVNFSSVSESILYGFSSFTVYPILIQLFNVSILFGILYLLYKNKIFLKV